MCNTLVFHVRCSWDVFFTILHLELCGLYWHLPYLSSTHGVFRVDPIGSVELRCVFVNFLSHGALIIKIILWLDLDIVLLIFIKDGIDACFTDSHRWRKLVHISWMFSCGVCWVSFHICLYIFPTGISVLYPRTGMWLSFLPCFIWGFIDGYG